MPQTPANWRQWLPAIRSTLMWVLPVAAIGLALQYGGFDLSSVQEEIHLEIDFPRTVALQGGATFVEANVRLKNNRDAPLDFEMPTECHVFRWIVAKADGQFVQARQTDLPECRGVQRLTLAPGEQAEAAVTMQLDDRRFQPGADYVLTYRFWGVEGDRTFRVD